MFAGLRYVVALTALVVVLIAPGQALAIPTFGADVAELLSPTASSLDSALPALRALRLTGATVARTDSLWQTAELSPPAAGVHSYDWSYDDAVAATLAKADLRWQAILDYSAWWAGESSAGPHTGVALAHISDYAEYASAFAARYGVSGSFWTAHPELPQLPVLVFEIWNEPDLPNFWSPSPDLAEYASMYLEARAAVRSADPTSKVIIGGLVFPESSLQGMIKARPDLRGNVDGIAIHPYQSSPANDEGKVAAFARLDAATLGVPLYVNEFGWQIGGQLSETDRDAYIQEMTAWLRADPDIADAEAFCWGCAGGYNLDGRSAAASYAAGIAGALPALDGILAPIPTGGGDARAQSGPGHARGHKRGRPRRAGRCRRKHATSKRARMCRRNKFRYSRARGRMRMRRGGSAMKRRSGDLEPDRGAGEDLLPRWRPRGPTLIEVKRPWMVASSPQDGERRFS